MAAGGAYIRFGDTERPPGSARGLGKEFEDVLFNNLWDAESGDREDDNISNQEITAELMNERWEMIIKISRGELDDNAIREYLAKFRSDREIANFLLESGEVGKYGDYKKMRKKMVAKKRRKERKNARA